MTSDWEQLDWPSHERHVRRLQARLVKATREKRWGKVKSLQWLLTHSFSGKALAVKRVTDKTDMPMPPDFPAHVTLAARLTRLLRQRSRHDAGLKLSADLRALYIQLALVFEEPRRPSA
ncbi:hypothetical protein AW736_02675 [Termitidicoccus mucosus]|uniref:Reverse transcriptase N-terminal domain-containing protein n=1 Tax=Termitidicoccus mucosus TaxID=1184151 RepID=A0A178IPD5_9BACT|nr:hypothetical protein AW736_02675 [Opitutaceae bacterium TSB47]